jgi:hypothetical protein
MYPGDSTNFCSLNSNQEIHCDQGTTNLCPFSLSSTLLSLLWMQAIGHLFLAQAIQQKVHHPSAISKFFSWGYTAIVFSHIMQWFPMGLWNKSTLLSILWMQEFGLRYKILQVNLQKPYTISNTPMSNEWNTERPKKVLQFEITAEQCFWWHTN